ncbi:MAG: glycosyltransferase [Candidatus Helarchaeota archaeon]
MKRTRKVKIAFIIDTIHENLGGTEKQLILLLENLNRDKFEPFLCYFRKSKWLEKHSLKWNTYFFRFNSFFSFKDYLQLYKFSRFLRSKKIDIVQTFFRDGNIVGTVSAKLAGIERIISTRRNLGYWHNKRELLLLKILNAMTYRILANSKIVKSYVHQVENVPLNKIDVIYNGFDLSGYSKPDNFNSEKLKSELGINPENKVITLVANLRPVKRIDVFINAAQLVLSKYPKTTFLILGDGPERKNLKTLAHELDVSENILFLGSRNDVPNILFITDIAVLSSQSEGLSNSIIEYMAAGLPVICTKVGGNVELIESNKTGVLVEPNSSEKLASAITSLLDNPQKASELAKAAEKKAYELFNLKKFIKNNEKYYLNLYNNF